MVAAEESLDAERVCDESLERELAIEVEKRQQILAKRQGTSKTAISPLAKGEYSL